nr:hypothetical protein [Oligoflexales bacterium]
TLRCLAPKLEWPVDENTVVGKSFNTLDEEQLLNLWVKSRLRYFGLNKEEDLFTALPIVDSHLILSALYRLEGRGEVMRGLYSCDATATEWIYRSHLMQLQKQTRECGKPQFKALELAEYWQLLIQQQRTYQRTFSEKNLLSVIEQIAGWQAPLKIWEDEILASRLQNYDARILDQLCLQGVLNWSRLLTNSESATLTKVQALRQNTPISIYPRVYQTWLQQKPAQKPAQLPRTIEVVYAHLFNKGASFASDLPAALRLFPEDIHQALLKLAALGLAHSDSLTALRGKKIRGNHRGTSTFSSTSYAQEFNRQIHLGRWSLIAEQDVHEQYLDFWLDLLLKRWGILFYEITLIEAHAPNWQDLRSQLRRREAQGLLYSGYFIKGLSGEQYAEAKFLEQAQKFRPQLLSQNQPSLHYIHRQDPLNILSLYPIEQRPDIKRGERILVKNGKVVAYAEKGKTELFCDFGSDTAKIERNLRLQQLWRHGSNDIWSN